MKARQYIIRLQKRLCLEKTASRFLTQFFSLRRSHPYEYLSWKCSFGKSIPGKNALRGNSLKQISLSLLLPPPKNKNAFYRKMQPVHCVCVLSVSRTLQGCHFSPMPGHLQLSKFLKKSAAFCFFSSKLCNLFAIFSYESSDLPKFPTAVIEKTLLVNQLLRE